MVIGFPPLSESRNWHIATNSFKLQRETHSCNQQNSVEPISAISWLAHRYHLFAAGAPLKWISYKFRLKPLKPGFHNLKSELSLNVKIKYQRFQAKGRPFVWYHFDPGQFSLDSTFKDGHKLEAPAEDLVRLKSQLKWHFVNLHTFFRLHGAILIRMCVLISKS